MTLYICWSKQHHKFCTFQSLRVDPVLSGGERLLLLLLSVFNTATDKKSRGFVFDFVTFGISKENSSSS